MLHALQERQFRMLAQYLVKFPIVKGPVDVQNEIIECVQENLVQKNKEQEDRINNMVYQLYGFDKMEADYIKNHCCPVKIVKYHLDSNSRNSVLDIQALI